MPDLRPLVRMSLRERYHVATAGSEWIPKLNNARLGVRCRDRSKRAFQSEYWRLLLPIPGRQLGRGAALHAL
jgi:hypothetical protein